MKIIKKIWAIIENNDGKVLIFQEEINWKKLLNIVKWTYDESLDKTWLEWLKREVFEETNIQNFTIKDVFDIFPKYYTDHISCLLVFVIYVDSFNQVISNKNIQENENIGDYVWIDKNIFSQLQKKDFVDERIYNVLKRYFMIDNFLI